MKGSRHCLLCLHTLRLGTAVVSKKCLILGAPACYCALVASTEVQGFISIGDHHRYWTLGLLPGVQCYWLSCHQQTTSGQQMIDTLVSAGCGGGGGPSCTPGSLRTPHGTSAAGVGGMHHLAAPPSHINHAQRLILVCSPHPTDGPTTASDSNDDVIGNTIVSLPCWQLYCLAPHPKNTVSGGTHRVGNWTSGARPTLLPPLPPLSLLLLEVVEVGR